MSSFEPAKASQRVLATLINTIIIFGFTAFAEWIAATSTAPNQTAKALVALKSLFGLSAIFWMICGQARSSPGLALMKLKLVSAEDPASKPAMITALLRPLPFIAVAALVILPTALIPRNLATLHFVGVLLGALFLAGNAAPLWTGNERITLLDKWLKVRVARK